MTLRLVRGRKPVELPATWEGTGDRRIVWSDWTGPHRTWVCPPPDVPYGCEGCGVRTEEETASGKVMSLPGETMEVEQVFDSKRRPGWTWSRWAKVPAMPRMRLVAFRCMECGFVEIVDAHPEYTE